MRIFVDRYELDGLPLDPYTLVVSGNRFYLELHVGNWWERIVRRRMGLYDHYVNLNGRYWP